MPKAAYTIDDLQYLMSCLRDPKGGCPWDLEQDYASIAPSTIEEAYEVVDAIEREDYQHLREELGDLLFQVVFYSQLAKEEERFQFGEVVSDLVEKLVRRHPHVFPTGRLDVRCDEDSALSEEIVKKNWEQLKREEREIKGKVGILDDIPLGLAALSRAQKLQKRAAQVGFDWAEVGPVIDKLDEEVDELKHAIKAGDGENIASELGDLLFSVVNVSRHFKIDAETALRKANNKFTQRFAHIERRCRERSVQPDDLSLEELNQYWEEAKNI